MKKNLYTQGEYLEKNPTWHAEDSLWKAGKIKKMLTQNNVNPESVVEVGCGSGEILNHLSDFMEGDIAFSGYDISPQAIKICNQINNDKIEFYLNDFTGEEGVFFDLLLCMDVLEHLECYTGFLKNIKIKSRYKIFHIPLDLSVQTVLRGAPILKARSQLGHIHYFTRELAIETLKDAGYEILDYFYTSGATELPAKSFESWIARIPRAFFFRLNEDIAVRLLGRYSLLVLAR